MFGSKKVIPPTDAELRAARLTSPAPWTAHGVSAEVVVVDSRWRPTPLVLLTHDGGCLRLHLTGVERLARGRQGIVENSDDSAWLASMRTIASDSPAGDATRGIDADHVVIISPGADPRHDPMRVHAVLPLHAVDELASWARAAADAELAARERVAP